MSSEDFGLRQSRVRQIVYKLKKYSSVATFHRSGCPAEIGVRRHQRIIRQVTLNLKVIAKDLQASLGFDDISVNELNVRRTLNKCGVPGR